jgi:hypothetical protein
MSGQERAELDRSHLRREVRTALELAIVTLAPAELIDRLATATGLLEALSELPPDSPPARALVPRTTEQARSTLAEWHAWQEKHLSRGRA